MYQVELYLRVRRACMVDGMSTRGSVPVCSVCTETPFARCSRTRRRQDTEDDNLPEDPRSDLTQGS